MSSRNYGQACSVASFLDQLGSRWTLLIIRDLLIGPRRFKDLLDGLPGIGPNLLTARLGELQGAGIIDKERNARGQFYVLTQKGWSLEPVILSMARWGLQFLEPGGDEKLNRPDLLVVAFRAAFRPEVAQESKESYEFRIGDTTFFARIDDGRLETGLGPADHPTMIYTATEDTFDQIVSGALDEQKARDAGLLEIVGTEQTYQRFLNQFSHSKESRG